jgi:hypothetical protein
MDRLMGKFRLAGLVVLVMGLGWNGSGLAQEAGAGKTQLTIYNQDFAVARTTVPLNLKPGMNEVSTTRVTRQLEPDSVVLRDPESHHPIEVLEQDYDAAVVNQAWLLEKYEGKTIDFQLQGTRTATLQSGEEKTVPPTVVQGRIVRAGSDPLIDVDGKMRFQLPGTPLFPATTDGLLLKPTLRWRIEAEKAANFTAELDYITHGMKWQATYNVLVPASEDTTVAEKADVMGWVTIENKSGTEFPEATIQLIAGDVAKVQQYRRTEKAMTAGVYSAAGAQAAPQVTQKAFDEFHLYDLHRTVELKNGETKQVQFLEASGVAVSRRFELDGASETTPTHVSVVEKIKNSEANHLGMPIPAGRLRVYRRDTDGQVQFVGESMIEHTPAEREISIVTGKAFDVTGTRKQTEQHQSAHSSDASYEVNLANQKAQPVTVHVIEHMGWANWKITKKSAEFEKKDSETVDFAVVVPAKGEATLTYSMNSSW